MCFACTSFVDDMTHEELLEATVFSEAQRLGFYGNICCPRMCMSNGPNLKLV
jgi:hypothetical protein